MKLRLEGTPTDIHEYIKRLQQTFIILETSKLYKNRSNDNYRIYLEVA